LEHQNRLRGLISAFRSRRFVEGEPNPRFPTFRTGLKKLRLDARVALGAEDFYWFLEWVRQQIEAQLQELSRQPVGYEELSGVIADAPIADLEIEFRWIAALIEANASQINAFRLSAEVIERLTIERDERAAIVELERVDEIFGSTFWSVDLRIALEQAVGGLEKQKSLAAKLRSVHRRGLLPFVAHHISVRNELKTTMDRFREDVRKRIDEHRFYDGAVRNYLKYRLLGEFSATQSGVADLLRVEQSHSVFDLYETFVAVAQQVARDDGLSPVRSVLLSCIRRLSGVDDFRLTKLELLLAGNTKRSTLGARNSALSDALFSLNIAQIKTELNQTVRRSYGCDVWEAVYGGLSVAGSDLSKPERVTPRQLLKLIGRIHAGEARGGDGFGLLDKLSANFHSLSLFAGVREFLDFFRERRPDSELRPWLVGLHSPTTGIEDVGPIGPRVGTGGTPTAAAWAQFHRLSPTTAGPAVLLATARMIRDGEYAAAVAALERSNYFSFFGPIRLLRNQLLFHANFLIGQRQKIIELIADEGARGSASRRFLPLSVLARYEWADFKPTGESLAAPIALHLLWTETQSDATASLLRYATGYFLRHAAVSRPSMLVDQGYKYATRQLVYFLNEVCTPNILDASRLFKSSREVAEERQAVCAVLRDLDPANASRYQDEVMLISNQLALDEGKWIVDRTRIHVDADALLRWGSRELSEDYARYRDLSMLAPGPVQNFDEVIRDLLSPVPARRGSFIPENEADAVLVTILSRLADEFLSNSTFGLDFYLSKRVRHQSFVGLIRGPLEFADIITTRESEGGEYRPNEYWLNKFANAGAGERSALGSAFGRFAATFDAILVKAKEAYFHVRSQEYPEGLLSVELTAPIIALARAVARLDATLEDVLRTGIAVLWGALEPSLARVRLFISDELKTKIAGEFDRLRADVRAIAEHDVAFHEFDMVVGGVSTEVQHALDDAATWFTHADIAAHQRAFTLEQVVRIAVDAALKCQRGFVPQISQTVKGDVQVAASSLVFVHDVLFVALDNIRAHSGVKHPRVDVSVVANVDAGLLMIEVESEARTQRLDAKEKALQELREVIAAGAVGRRTRSEGGTGFIKLAAVVRQSDRGRIEFGFVSGGERFRLTIAYSLIVQSL
jgi:hypothetical protein